MAASARTPLWDIAGILNGSELWEQDTPLLGSAAIVVVAAVIIGVLLGSFMMRTG